MINELTLGIVALFLFVTLVVAVGFFFKTKMRLVDRDRQILLHAGEIDVLKETHVAALSDKDATISSLQGANHGLSADKQRLELELHERSFADDSERIQLTSMLIEMITCIADTINNHEHGDDHGIDPFELEVSETGSIVARFVGVHGLSFELTLGDQPNIQVSSILTGRSSLAWAVELQENSLPTRMEMLINEHLQAQYDKNASEQIVPTEPEEEFMEEPEQPLGLTPDQIAIETAAQEAAAEMTDLYSNRRGDIYDAPETGADQVAAPEVGIEPEVSPEPEADDSVAIDLTTSARTLPEETMGSIVATLNSVEDSQTEVWDVPVFEEAAEPVVEPEEAELTNDVEHSFIKAIEVEEAAPPYDFTGDLAPTEGNDFFGNLLEDPEAEVNLTEDDFFFSGPEEDQEVEAVGVPEIPWTERHTGVSIFAEEPETDHMITDENIEHQITIPTPTPELEDEPISIVAEAPTPPKSKLKPRKRGTVPAGLSYDPATLGARPHESALSPEQDAELTAFLERAAPQDY